jgi:alpha-galactosidase
MRAGDAPQKVDVSIKGLKQLTLLADGDVNNEHNFADWADAKIMLHSDQFKDVRPNTIPAYKEEAVILTPKPGPQPRLTGPKVFGVRPGHPLLFTVTASGERPMTFSAEGLPKGLQLDSQSGRISGKLTEKGEHRVTLRVKNARGVAQREFKIVCGETLGLVPAMGWNSWNCFGDSVTAQNVKDAADVMVKSGLINHGWSYVNIDEGWNMNPRSKDTRLHGPERDAQGRMLPNYKFPDLKGLVDHIHGLGLRVGIYTSPGPCACGDYTGSLGSEETDARHFAELEFDYLKYDMCSYNQVLRERTQPHPSNNLKQPMDRKSPEYLAELQRPWRVMRTALDKLDRDLIYSISGNTRTWGKEIGANSWRTSSDITDSWLEMVNGWEESVSRIGFMQKNNSAYAQEHSNGPELSGPGYFNDFDMLAVGHVGWGAKQHPTLLTPNEQYTHISLWCLLNSPLLMGCDLTKLDEFTLSLLTNDEVLDVNQDPLAQQAARVAKHGNLEVWAKDMEDGSKAVGLFNRGYLASDVSVNWSDLGVTDKQRVRDLWRQKDLGEFSEKFTAAEVPRHGVLLIRLWPAK